MLLPTHSRSVYRSTLEVKPVTPAVYPVKIRGETRWCLDRVEGGKRKRTFYLTEKLANADLKPMLAQIQATGEVWLSLTARDRGILADIVFYARLKNIDLSVLRSIWETHIHGRKPATDVQKTLQDAIQETIAAKKAAGRRPIYVNSLESYLNLFAAGRYMLTVDQITSRDIEKWFNDRKEAPSTRASNLGRLSALFDLCYRRDYISSNPCEKVERVRVTTGKPMIFTAKQCRALLETCQKRERRLLPYLTLCLFTGIRPAECEKLTWADVDFEKARLTLHEASTKKHHWRYVPIEPAAAAWLGVCDRKKAMIPDLHLDPLRQTVSAAAGLKWEKDILRKTAASFLMAKYQDAQKVSEWLGNSPAILRRHYRELLSPEEAEEYLNIKPK